MKKLQNGKMQSNHYIIKISGLLIYKTLRDHIEKTYWIVTIA